MRSADDDAGAERLRERFLRRMWNLASFKASNSVLPTGENNVIFATLPFCKGDSTQFVAARQIPSGSPWSF
jgi:hypothetical protein